MRTAAVSLGLALVLVLTGCSSQQVPPKAAVVEHGYPIQAADLLLGVATSLPDVGLRHLAQDLVDVEGVRLIEADYGTRSVQVIFEPSLNTTERQRLADRLASWPGVSGVTTDARGR